MIGYGLWAVCGAVNQAKRRVFASAYAMFTTGLALSTVHMITTKYCLSIWKEKKKVK